MLKEIKCELFREPVVTFHHGLNVVLGDNAASNSIGKSTILMIIDFVFAGNTYIKANYDAIETLGHHDFNFCFEFENELLFFTRSTERYKFVSYCNKNYEQVEEVGIEEYKRLLREKYKLHLPHTSFRDIVGLYSRIWGKKNYDIDRPLQQSGENASIAVNRLIKLCNKYDTIKSFEDQIDDLSDRKNAISAASKKDYLPSINKTDYIKSIKLIDEIKKEIAEISTDLEGNRASYDAIVSKEIIDLKNIKSALMQQRNVCSDRLDKTKQNIASKNPALKKQLEKLNEFFPDINMKKLVLIDSFHSNISGILKETLIKNESELEDRIAYLEAEINTIDTEITTKLNMKDTPRYTVDRLLELASSESQLLNATELYEKKQDIDSNLVSAKKDLAIIKNTVLIDINSLVNTQMHELNKKINTDGRRAPSLQLKESGYEFKVFNDTGTGKAYSSLITLDLAILETTKLPILIHDTMLFKNIENTVFDHIVGIYNEQTKQIFIAIDEINKFAKETERILNSNAVLKLSYDKTLFIKDWKKVNDNF